MNNCLASLCVYEQKGETPLLQAVNRGKGNVVRYLVNEQKMDITQLDQVRLLATYCNCSCVMYTITILIQKYI